MRHWGLYIYGCLALFWGGLSQAQEDSEKIPLTRLLAQLETQHDHTFNYTEETVADILVSPPDKSLSFIEVLQNLSVQTKLVFTPIGDRLISINPPEVNRVCGYLKDRSTGQPLAFATLQTNAKATVSDESGYFDFIADEASDQLTIRYLGYETLTVGIPSLLTGNCIDIVLDPSSEALDQVLLSSYLVEGISKLNNGALEVDFKTFTALPGLIETDVLQTVQALPGIQSSNETVSNINIRGGTNDQNLVLWDDIKMYQTGHFFGLISAFNPQITQQVTIEKNGSEASYSDGVSGSIKMKTEDRINKTLTASFGLNLIDANVFLDIPVGPVSSLQIGARKSLSDLVVTPTYEAYFTRISQDTEVEANEGQVSNTDRNFNFYDVSLRWLYKISNRDKLRVNFLYIDNTLSFNENAQVENMPLSRESSVAQISLGAGVYYERQWNKKLSSSFRIYESDYRLRAINANILEEQRFLQENSVSETGIKAKTTYARNETSNFTVGYELIETKVTNLDDVDVPLVRTLISEVVRTHSGFGQYKFRSPDAKSTLKVGLRYNYLDKFNASIIEPRLWFTQQFLRHFGVEVGGEAKHQITSQIINFQNDFLGIEKRRWQLSNNGTIPIITSKQGSVGLNFNQNGWLVSIEGYLKDVDGITSQAQGFQNQFEFIKTDGSYQVLGCDVLLRKKFKYSSFWLSYSFMDNQYTFADLDQAPFPSNYEIPHALTFGSTYTHKGVKISAGFNWRSGNPTTLPVEGAEIVAGAINYGPTNTARFPDYFRVDTSVRYQFTIGATRAEAGVSVWNLLDQTNTVGNFYRINEQGNVVANEQNALGITPNAMLRVSL